MGVTQAPLTMTAGSEQSTSEGVGVVEDDCWEDGGESWGDGDDAGVVLSRGNEGPDVEGRTQTPLMLNEGGEQTTGEGEGGFDEEGGGCEDGDTDCGTFVDGKLGADVDESGVEGVEVGAGVDGAGVCAGVSDGLLAGEDDTGGKTHLPARSRPGGQLTVGEGDDDEGCAVDGGLDGKLGADVDESVVEGVEVGAGVDGAGVCAGVSDGLLAGEDDTGGKTHLPARSKPRGQLTVGVGDDDEGCEVDGGLVIRGEVEEVAGSEEGGGEEAGSLVGEVEGGSVVVVGSGAEEGTEELCGGGGVLVGEVMESGPEGTEELCGGGGVLVGEVMESGPEGAEEL